MSDINLLSQQEKVVPDKAFSAEQLIRYARDLAEVVQGERARRKALEEANKKLQEEIFQRKKAQEELIDSEERYRSLFEDSRDPIYITDGEDRFVDVNESFLELFGWTKAEVVGNKFGPLVDPLISPKFWREIEEKGSVRNLEIQLHKKDGASMWCVITATISRGKDGRILRHQGIIRDVTEQKLSYELVQHAKKMEALSKLAGGIAHEIRNPLAISSSAAQLLADDEVTEAFRKQCATKIVSGIERASVIVENLLMLVRPLKEIDMMALDLVSLVRESEKSVVCRSKGQGVQLVFRYHPEPLVVKGSASLLMQVLVNLLLNALAAMKDKGETLSASVEKGAEDALIVISDTGRGIPTEHLDKVFDPFFTGSRRDSGRGLGLSISYSIVKQHSGDIRVTSAPGRGTTFTVSIPLA